MRNAFADEMTALAAADDRLVLLSGDIGNRLFDGFKARCPGRFYNCGVAEANMVGVAAGLAMSGLRPVCYTIAAFGTFRCLEQIRVDLCYHHLPVVIVGAGSGLAYASLGGTHHSCEDAGMLRLLPGMTVLAPGDPWEVRSCLREALRLAGPSYLRIGKKGEPGIHSAPPDVGAGRALVVRPGRDLGILAAGVVLPACLEAAGLLARRGIEAEVVSCPSIKPLDEAMLGRVFSEFPLVATVEEHSRLGGLGGAVAEWMTDQPRVRARLARLGTPDEFWHETGGQEHAHERMGLTPPALAESLAGALAQGAK
ncbi:MAG TPA: transketolase C-terminal domain-containing protein [Opitutaceae bacterium]|jgi:transketolase